MNPELSQTLRELRVLLARILTLLPEQSPELFPESKPTQGPQVSPKPRKPRSPTQLQNDHLILALVQASSASPVTLQSLTPKEARFAAPFAAQIRQMSPEVTPDQIALRAANYRILLPDCLLTAPALAKHWRRCAQVTQDELSTYRRTHPHSRIPQELVNLRGV